MEKFKIIASRTDKYVVHIDPKIWNETVLKDWSAAFQKANKLSDIAEDLSYKLMRQGNGEFVDGYGYVKTISHSGREITQYNHTGKIPEDKFCKGIIVHVVSQDSDYDINTIEDIHD